MPGLVGDPHRRAHHRVGVGVGDGGAASTGVWVARRGTRPRWYLLLVVGASVRVVLEGNSVRWIVGCRGFPAPPPHGGRGPGGPGGWSGDGSSAGVWPGLRRGHLLRKTPTTIGHEFTMHPVGQECSGDDPVAESGGRGGGRAGSSFRRTQVRPAAPSRARSPTPHAGSNHPHCSGLLSGLSRRVVAFPGVASVGMTPSSLPSLGASEPPSLRALRTHRWGQRPFSMAGSVDHSARHVLGGSGSDRCALPACPLFGAAWSSEPTLR